MKSISNETDFKELVNEYLNSLKQTEKCESIN